MDISNNIRGFHRGHRNFDIYIDPDAYQNMGIGEVLTGMIYPNAGADPYRYIAVQRSQGKTLLYTHSEQDLETLVLRLPDIEFLKLGVEGKGYYGNRTYRARVVLE